MGGHLGDSRGWGSLGGTVEGGGTLRGTVEGGGNLGVWSV